MILTKDITEKITNNGTYSCEFVKQRFASAFFEEPSPYGNIITFVAKTAIGPITFPKAIVIAGELPNVNIYGGVCFQRLFSAQIGSLINSIINKQCYVNNNSLFVEDKQTSVSVVNSNKDTILFHIVLAQENDKNLTDMNVYDLKLADEQIESLQNSVIECFDFLTKSIFLETRRDNI